MEKGVSAVNFVKRDDDDGFGTLGELHVLVDLEMILGVFDLGDALDVVLDGGFVSGNEGIEGHQKLFSGLLGIKLTAVEHLLQHS